MKKINFIIFFLLVCLSSNSQVILSTNKAAKVGNEIILISDVQKRAKIYKISYDQALNELIDNAVLYIGAKITTDPPTEEQILDKIREDKIFYANKVGKSLNNITENEFLEALPINNLSMKVYKEYIKRELWIEKFLDNVYKSEKIDFYLPNEKDIENFIKNNPEYFVEKEGIILSMIYFSYYDSNSNKKTSEQIENIKVKANECFNILLNKSEDFITLVKKYSDDLISLNNKPPGRVGKIYFDDPRLENNFNKEIIDLLKNSEIGLVRKLFETNNGLYIFYIEEKIKAQPLSEDAARNKAISILESRYLTNFHLKVKEKVIKELKKQINIEIYKN